MRTISVINRKGGTGKTTITLLLAKFLASNSIKTLVIDNDGQCNLTLASGFTKKQIEEEIPTLLDAFEDSPFEVKKYILKTRFRYDILAGSPLLDKYYSESDSYKIFMKIKSIQRLMDVLENMYDVVLIDNMPNTGLNQIASLTASKEVLIVINPDDFSVAGLTTVLESIHDLVKTTGMQPFKNIWILVNRVRMQVNLQKEILKHIAKLYKGKYNLINFVIKESAKISRNVIEKEDIKQDKEVYETFKQVAIEMGFVKLNENTKESEVIINGGQEEER